MEQSMIALELFTLLTLIFVFSAGWYRSARNLTFALIYNASHMSPFDHQFETMDIFNRFIGAQDALVSPIPGTLVSEYQD
jgi:hypothetical protein